MPLTCELVLLGLHAFPVYVSFSSGAFFYCSSCPPLYTRRIIPPLSWFFLRFCAVLLVVVSCFWLFLFTLLCCFVQLSSTQDSFCLVLYFSLPAPSIYFAVLDIYKISMAIIPLVREARYSSFFSLSNSINPCFIFFFSFFVIVLFFS